MNDKTLTRKPEPAFLVLSILTGVLVFFSERMMQIILDHEADPSSIKASILTITPAGILISVFAAVLTYFLSVYFYRRIKRCRLKERTRRQNCIITLISAVLDFAVMLVWYLAHYPGAAMNDSINALIDPYIFDAQPIFYQKIVNKLFWHLEAVFSSSIKAISVIILLQMILMTLAVSYTVYYMASHGLPKAVLIITILYYAFYPAFGDYAATLVKDTLFSIGLLGFVLITYNLIRSRGKAKPDAASIVLFILCALCVAFSRTNGFWAVIAEAVILLFLLPEKQKIIACCLLVLLGLFHEKENRMWADNFGERKIFCESMSIPLSQIAAVVYTGGTIDYSTRQTINEILPMEEWSDSYLLHSVDLIKFNTDFNNDYLQSHKKEFLQAWSNIVKDNFPLCVKAFLYQTYGNWSLDVRTGKIYSEGQSYFSKLLNNAGSDSYWYDFLQKNNLENEPILTGCENTLRTLFYAVTVFTPGMAALIILYLLLVFIKDKTKAGIAACLPAALIWLSNMAAMPACNMARYYFYIYLILPVYIGIAILKNERAGKNS